MFVVFFFKQKTAYEMRISDWSSDVCSSDLFAFVMQGLGSGPISLFGTPEQKRRWLPGVANGSKIAALAMSEPDAGSDVANVSTVDVPDGKGFRLTGVKTWISNGGLADQYQVIARLGDAAGHKGLGWFVVGGGQHGCSGPL